MLLKRRKANTPLGDLRNRLSHTGWNSDKELHPCYGFSPCPYFRLGISSARRPSDVFNVEYGRGYSVKEVVDTIKKVTGKDFKVIEAPRRPGDPLALVADSTKIRSKLNWEPQFDDLEFIVRTAW